MKRRQFITLVGGAAAAWPFAARGQVPRKWPLIGRLSSGSRDLPMIAKFIDQFLLGMRELGDVEGRDFDITYAEAHFHTDQLMSVLVKAFNDLGYIEGSNIHFDHRFPAETPDRFAAALSHKLPLWAISPRQSRMDCCYRTDRTSPTSSAVQWPTPTKY